jgi:hypothetical protein
MTYWTRGACRYKCVSVACCLPSAICCLLSAACCLRSVFCFLLSAVCLVLSAFLSLPSAVSSCFCLDLNTMARHTPKPFFTESSYQISANCIEICFTWFRRPTLCYALSTCHGCPIQSLLLSDTIAVTL